MRKARVREEMDALLDRMSATQIAHLEAAGEDRRA